MKLLAAPILIAISLASVFADDRMSQELVTAVYEGSIPSSRTTLLINSE